MLNHGPADGPGPPAGDDAEAHETTTVEQGAFALARCSCGWTGPARRARARALEDARGHLPE